MVMPCSQNEIAVLYNYLQNIRKFTRIKAVTVGYRYIWLEPDLGVPTAALDMNMRRLGRLALVREEVVAQAALTEHDGHDSSVRLASWLSATAGRAATRIALHAGAIPHQREMPAFAAHLAFVAFCLGFGAAFGF